MTDQIVNFFSQFPPELATFLLAMTPLGELRLSIPVGILAFDLNVWLTYVLSVIGNMVPPTLIMLFAGRFHRWVQKRSSLFSRGWIKFLERAQNKAAGQYQKYGLLGLMIFVAVPLPLTGAWTGAAAAFVFGVPIKKAWPYVCLGVMIAGIIVAVATKALGRAFF